MIVEFIGNSGSGKTTIIKRFIADNPNFPVFFCDEWWYSKKKRAYPALIPYLFRFRLLRLLRIAVAVLRKKKVEKRRKLRQLRHLAFHYVIATKALKESKKGKIVFLSESFATLIPNLFKGECPDLEARFIRFLGVLKERDSFILVQNDLDEIIRCRTLRNAPNDRGDLRERVVEQRERLEKYISDSGLTDRIIPLEYHYNEDSLAGASLFLSGLFTNE